VVGKTACRIGGRAMEKGDARRTSEPQHRCWPGPVEPGPKRIGRSRTNKGPKIAPCRPRRTGKDESGNRNTYKRTRTHNRQAGLPPARTASIRARSILVSNPDTWRTAGARGTPRRGGHIVKAARRRV